MKMLATFLLLESLLCSWYSNAQTSPPIWRGDFDTCDTSQWTGHQYLAGDFAAVNTPLIQGLCAGKFIVHTGDSPINPGSGEERAEVDEKTTVTLGQEGQERRYSWSSYFPKADPVLGDVNPISNHQNTFTQWHGSPSGADADVFLDLDDDGTGIFSFQVGVKGGSVTSPARPSNMDSHGRYKMTPAIYNQWTNWEVHVFWSTDATKGFVEVKLNGNVVYPKTFATTLYVGGYSYLKQGFYRINRSTPLFSGTSTVYHDAMLITASGSTAPTQPNPPTGVTAVVN